MSNTFIPPDYRNTPDATWSTADLCDLALNDPSLELRIFPPAYRAFGGRSWYFGQVVAVPAPDGGGGVSLATLLAEPGHGKVLLVDGGGSSAAAILGDRMAGIAVQNGWSGVVIHGHVRDVRELARMPVGIHALNAVPNRAASMPTVAAGPQVTLHGITVRSGQWLYADEDGIVVLARRHTEGKPAA